MGAIRRVFRDLLRRADRDLQERAERRAEGMPEGPYGNRFGPGV